MNLDNNLNSRNRVDADESITSNNENKENEFLNKKRLKGSSQLIDEFNEFRTCHYCKKSVLKIYCLICPLSKEHVFCQECVNTTYVS